MKSFSFLSGIIIFFFFSSLVFSEDQTKGTWIPISSLNNYKGPAQSDVYVEGKFRRSFGETFQLCGCDILFRIPYKSQLFNYINNHLASKSSNVIVRGDITFIKRYNDWNFEVVTVNLLPEKDKEFFETRIEDARNNSEKLYDLAYQAKAVANECGLPEVMEYNKLAFTKAVEAELGNLDSKEFKRRYEIAQKMETEYKMPVFAFKVYRECLNLQPQNKELEGKLRDLGGKFYQGKWLLDDEIKTLSGLTVSKKGEWMVQEKFQFKNFYEKYKENSAHEESTYSLFGKKLKTGFHSKEVISILKIWPKNIWRKVDGNVRYDQWVLEQWNPKRKELTIYYLFFLNEKLVEMKSTSQRL